MEPDALADLCPLCGQSNSCQQVKQTEMLKKTCGTDACWCLSIKLDDQIRQDLKEQTNCKRCLCQTCIQKISQAQQ
tara:strand:- start:35 stop:262 length:228 start_codon:yes stop_codon:yes gene_type:complete